MDWQDILTDINQLERLVEKYDEQSRNGKDIWTLKNQIFESFKSTRFPTKEERQDAWSRFQSIITELKNKQDQINAAGEGFADKAEALLRTVSDQLSPGLFKASLTKDDFQSIRENLNETFQQLR